jgi:hypothetical protein
MIPVLPWLLSALTGKILDSIQSATSFMPSSFALSKNKFWLENYAEKILKSFEHTYIENYPCCAFLCKHAFHNMTLAEKGAAGIIFDIYSG